MTERGGVQAFFSGAQYEKIEIIAHLIAHLAVSRATSRFVISKKVEKRQVRNVCQKSPFLLYVYNTFPFTLFIFLLCVTYSIYCAL
jgi:hypothetical protein